jgi:hypothetical protein
MAGEHEQQRCLGGQPVQLDHAGFSVHATTHNTVILPYARVAAKPKAGAALTGEGQGDGPAATPRPGPGGRLRD